MNPQPTTTKATGTDIQVMAYGPGVPRSVNRDKPAPYVRVPNPTQETTVEGVAAAQRDRQDSLEFLHRLVMGS